MPTPTKRGDSHRIELGWRRKIERTVRTSSLFVAGLATVVVGLGAQSVPIPDSLPPGVTPEMVRRGRIVFEGPGSCTSCHGPQARGLLGPDLTDSEWWHAKGSYLAILQRILAGVPSSRSVSGYVMEPRGGASISDAEVQAVAAYVWSFSHPEAGDSIPHGVTRDMIDRGQRIFLGRGGCTNCHGVDAHGDVGPDLTDGEWLHAKGGYLAIVEKILSGVPTELSKTGVVMAPRGGANLTNADVHAVAAYVWVLSHPAHW